MRTILIPTDFSPNAQDAADYGIELFDAPEVQFVLLHTVYIPYMAPELAMPIDHSTEDYVKKAFDEELARLNERFPALRGSIETRFDLGEVVSVVCRLERHKDVHAVVMGTKGTSGWIEILMGSRAASMTQSVDCPVFVVPEKAKFKAPKRILFTTDLKSIPKTASWFFLKQIVQQHQSSIRLLHVAEQDERYTIHNDFVHAELDYHLLDIPHNFQRANGNSVAETIEQHLEGHDYDLLVMVSERGNLLHRTFHRSVSKKVVMHTEVPVLVLHE